MNNKTKLIGGIILILIIIGAVIHFAPSSKSVKGISLGINQPNTNFTTVGSKALVLGEGCSSEYGNCTAGATIDQSGNTDTGYSQNGIGLSMIPETVTGVFNSGTTTPCAILTPNATTTLWDASIRPTIASTTATITIASSTTAFATTSLIASGSIAGLTPYTWDAGINNSVLAPSTWVVFGLSNYALPTTGYVFTGVCEITVQTI